MEILSIAGQLFLCLTILVIFHELGHMLPARWFKTRVEKFYLFFNPWFSLYKKQIGETEFGIGWLPLGGYVKIAGMVDESMDKEQLKQEPQPWEFRSKPAWQRFIIMVGGVTINFLLGFLIYGFVLYQWGEKFLPNSEVKYGIYADSIGQAMGLRDGDQIVRIGEVPFDKFSPNIVIKEIVINNAPSITVLREGQETTLPVDPSYIQVLSSAKRHHTELFGARIPFVAAKVVKGQPADKAGIREGDAIIALNGEPTPYFNDFIRKITPLKNQSVQVRIVRNQTDTLELPVLTTAEGRMGVAPKGPDTYFRMEHQRYSLAQALPAGVGKGLGFLGAQLKAFGQMFKGRIKASESLGGFVSIAKLFAYPVEWEQFWITTAIISLILGFMNLLPIPGLDGGYVIFLIWEMVTGKRVSDEFMEKAITVGFIILLALMLYANGLDIFRLFQK